MRQNLTAAFIVLFIANVLAGQAPSASGFGGNVFVGTRGLDNNNYLGLVSEYDAARQGLRPSLGATFWGQKNGVFLDGGAEYRGDARDQQHYLRLDVNRYFRLKTTYDRFVYRLQHDPLDALDTAKGSVVVRHDDFSRGPTTFRAGAR